MQPPCVCVFSVISDVHIACTNLFKTLLNRAHRLEILLETFPGFLCLASA